MRIALLAIVLLPIGKANQFWTAREFDFVGAFPGEDFRLGFTKLFLSMHSCDAWDLPSMVGRYRDAGSPLWIPFGFLVGPSVISLLDRAREPVVVALWCYSLCYVAILVAFYVTSRQRNALLPAIAILAGTGVSYLAARFPRDPRGAPKLLSRISRPQGLKHRRLVCTGASLGPAG